MEATHHVISNLSRAPMCLPVSVGVCVCVCMSACTVCMWYGKLNNDVCVCLISNNHIVSGICVFFSLTRCIIITLQVGKMGTWKLLL